MSSGITVAESYETLREEIIQPEKQTYETRYFLMKWEPALGANAARIVRVLRSLGYYNRSTKTTRDGIPIDLPELAKMCGFSVATLKREFGSLADGSPRNPGLHKFVQREKNYRRDSVTGQVWREENIYRVKMTDPLHPDDEKRLLSLAEERQKGILDRKGQNEPNGNQQTDDRMAQSESDTSHLDSVAPDSESNPSQPDSVTMQNEPPLKTLTLNSSLLLLGTLNNTPDSSPAAIPENTNPEKSRPEAEFIAAVQKLREKDRRGSPPGWAQPGADEVKR